MAQVQQDSWQFSGGLFTDMASTSIPSGAMIACENFEVTQTGYERTQGYERFDGQAAPSSVDAVDGDTTAREAQRALINPVPGEGSIRGVWVYDGDVYAFRNNVGSTECKMFKATSSGWVEVTTGLVLSPSGNYQFVNYNFLGTTSGYKMYGCDGVNKAFEFDGTTFTQIDTGMGADDKPTYIAAHAYHLFLAFEGGSLQHSSTGLPLNWDAATGTAGEIGVGDEITGIKSMVGDALLILMRNRISMLYGTSVLDWQSKEVRTQDDLVGAYSGTVQTVANGAIYLDDRGITTISSTSDFGNFKAATSSQQISNYINDIRPNSIGSVSIKSKTQYRIFFSRNDGKTECVVLTAQTGGLLGFGRILYPFELSCSVSSEDGTGQEVVYAGASNGYVYQLDSGTSFDGDPYQSALKTSFSSSGNPTIRKRYKNGLMVVSGGSDATIRVKPEFSFGSVDVSGHAIRDFDIDSGGGTWGVDNWGEFNWSSPRENFGYIDVTGTGTSISITVAATSNLSEPFTLNSAIVDFIPRRMNKR